MTTMLWEFVGPLQLVVLVHGAKAPGDAEWEAYAAWLHAVYGSGKLRRVLVFADGPGPNARQRQRLHYFGEHTVSTAVVTHTVVARGVVTALSWFYEIRAFSPVKLDAALEYLAIPRFDRIGVRKTIAALRDQLSSASADTSAAPSEFGEVIRSPRASGRGLAR